MARVPSPGVLTSALLSLIWIAQLCDLANGSVRRKVVQGVEVSRQSMPPFFSASCLETNRPSPVPTLSLGGKERLKVPLGCEKIRIYQGGKQHTHI